VRRVVRMAPMVGNNDTSALLADLDMARRTLMTTETVSAVLVKDARILSMTMGQGVQPLIDLLHRAGETARGAALGDKIVGLAPAWLAIAHGIGAVFARTVSRPARELLEKHHVPLQFLDEVPWILSAGRKTLCPLEEALRSAGSLEEAVTVLRNHPLVSLP